MKRLTNSLLVALLCINILFITGLVIHFTGMPGLPLANAQVRANDYILVPGNMQLGQQIVWVIDLKTHQITSCRYNSTRKMIEFGQVTNVNVPVNMIR